MLAKKKKKEKSNVDGCVEKCGTIADCDSIDLFEYVNEESDIIFPVRKRPRRLIIEDDSDDEDSEYRLRMAEGILQTVPSQNYN